MNDWAYFIAVCFILVSLFYSYEQTTKCRYCGKLGRRHDSHCPWRILEDDE